MMKRIAMIFAPLLAGELLFSSVVLAQSVPMVPVGSADRNSELALAYAKEFSLLQKQKQALDAALASHKKEAENAVEKAEAELAKLQNKQVASSRNLEKIAEEMEGFQRGQSDKSSEKEAALASLGAAKLFLKEQGFCQSCKFDENSFEDLSAVFAETVAVLGGMARVRKLSGHYFGIDGQKIEGELIHIGQIAAFGVTKGYEGVLAPAGNGNLKLYKGGDGRAIPLPKDIFTMKPVGVFLFESTVNPVEELKVKNLVETISEGGRIGWVIVSLGILAAIAILYKLVVLYFAAKGQNAVAQQVDVALAKSDLQEAQRFCQDAKVYSAKLISLILSQIDQGSEALENAFNQGFIEENRTLDRFTMFITVVAAVAPLFGLLGTVMGMIETFDVITKVGTGNPKVLSAGIAEALIATMLGLLVAIPSLLAGNLLNAWASQIKNRLESVALKIVSVATEKTPDAV